MNRSGFAMWAQIFQGLSLECIVKAQEPVAVATGPFQATLRISQAPFIV